MDDRDGVQSLLAHRKLTRAITDEVRVRMTEYLKALAPLLRPKAVLGDYVQGGPKEPSRRADKAFGDLKTLYESIAVARPFNLPHELSTPLSLGNVGLEITPLDYIHEAKSGPTSRRIKVRRPLTWVLTYAEFPPNRLEELLDGKARSVEEVQRFVLHYIVLHVATKNDPALMQVFDALHFPLTPSRIPKFGDLPITRIGIPVETTRPSDSLVIQSAELTGMDAFEEIVKVDDIATLGDPLKARLLEIARQQAPELV
jgi:hypothetical protein